MTNLTKQTVKHNRQATPVSSSPTKKQLSPIAKDSSFSDYVTMTVSAYVLQLNYQLISKKLKNYPGKHESPSNKPESLPNRRVSLNAKHKSQAAKRVS